VQSFRNGLLQCGSLGRHKPCQQTGSGVGSSLRRSTGPARSLHQRRLPTGSQPPSGIHLLRCGVPSTGYRWVSAPLWTSMNCRETACLTMVFSRVAREDSLLRCLEHLLPSPSPTLVSAELFLSHHITPLSPLPFHHRFFFLPLPKYVITEVLPLSLICLALASGGSILELAGTGFIRHGGSFSQLPTEATPIAPSCYQNLAMQTCNSLQKGKAALQGISPDTGEARSS